MNSLILIAQDPAAGGGEQPAAPFWMNPLFLMGMMVLFFFVVMWPAQRRAKREQANMLANLKPGVKVVDDPANKVFPVPLDTTGKDDCLVGRIRKNLVLDNALDLWVVGDQVRKGAALNAVQIAEIL